MTDRVKAEETPETAEPAAAEGLEPVTARVARGKAASTPFAMLGSVAAIVLLFAAIVVGVTLVIYWWAG